MNAREKVADSLLKIYTFFKDKSNGTSFSKSIPRKFLADISGISLGKTIRVISEFRTNNIISTNGSEIIFNNPNKLKEIVAIYYKQ